LTGSRIENKRPNANSVVNNMLQLNPTDPIYTNGEPTPILSNDVLNPLINERIYSDLTFNNRILANIAPSFEIMDGLTYRLNLGADYSTTNRDVQTMRYSTDATTNIGSL